MRTYYAYIRVSTVKQGEKGSSLTEQRDAIERYAQKHGLQICEWYEEQVTAAKRGRAVFRRMLTRLKKVQAHGLIMHKVDRGARNLADWAELAALMDVGVDVHFAHEAIDLSSRGGRLSADIQAVVAADYIRNLRDEVKKGIYGRLKQGMYPFGAPPGYCNNGKGELKTIDPVQGPLVRLAFEKYASGTYGLHALRAQMNELGLRNSVGRPFHLASLAVLLKNPFYYGLLRVKGQSFIGAHEPIITKELFDACRARAAGRLVSPTRVWGKAEYRFRQLVTCAACDRKLIAETQRGHIYYRCHSKSCKGVSVKEEAIAEAINLPLTYLPTPPLLESFLRDAFNDAEGRTARTRQDRHTVLRLQLSALEAREQKLTDLFIDGLIDRSSYQARRATLQNEHIGLQSALDQDTSSEPNSAKVDQFIEHAKALGNMAQSENARQIREIAKRALSNILILGKTLDTQWSGAFQMLIEVGGFHAGALDRQADRTSISCVTERDEAFRKALYERRDELYQAVIATKLYPLSGGSRDPHHPITSVSRPECRT